MAAHADAQTSNTSERPVSYNIPAQPLPAALLAFAQQSGVEVLFAYDEVSGVRAPALVGAHTRADALRILLSGADISANVGADGVVRLEYPSRPQGEARLIPTDAPASTTAPNRPAPAALDPIDGDDLVVTGTRIRGAGPIGSHVVTLDHVAIEESGLATSEELMRTLPQNFGGGFAQHVSFQNGNIGGGSGVNLRGLGADATLTLVNGRRQPVMGLRGNFTDISSIPASAIERIEVLPDSASAIYGSELDRSHTWRRCAHQSEFHRAFHHPL
ncbi:TonB-dependent receptor plug domain-containing protein [Vitreimonas flagellata]|uniref:TonB-dependent receptor plug domain-containing protein n=1 Tax=Vitreimonas flagellata TaxID=2560861 RepID=UPI001431AC23|nr:TonB-dependent receptor plug domain-containing protein [Vitreimonas flagellata]